MVSDLNKNTINANALNQMTIRQAALTLSQAKLGLKFLPLCPANHKGASTNHKAKCSNPGKVPVISGWPKEASNDPATLEKWFTEHNSRNLGMILGGEHGIVGFDIDGEYGQDKMDELFEGSIPTTWQFSTPGGGSRYLFSIPNSVKLQKLSDVKPATHHEELALLADGQMTVIPPSRHHNGGKYRWIEGRGPGDIPLANLPENVLIQLQKGSLKLTNEEKNIPINTLGSSLLVASPPNHLKTLSGKCKVIDEAVTQQSLDGCNEIHWHHIVSMLVRSGYTETALAFSQMSTKHDTHSEQRIRQMDEEQVHAKYGSTRCTTFGCSKEQIRKCHGKLRINNNTKEPINSPIALIKREGQKIITNEKPTLEQYSSLFEGDYVIHQNALCQIKYKKDSEPNYKPLANFVARIHNFVSKTDGEEKVAFYILDGVLIESKKRLNQIEVPAGEFESMKWLSKWGPTPNIYPGNGIRDTLRFAIQSTASAAKHEKVFTHLGWVQLNGKWSYLNANGALGRKNVKVELDSRLKNYALPDRIRDPKHAMKTSLALLDLAPHRVTLALWGLTFLSPLCEWMRQEGIEPKFLMWLYGYTGSRKTTLAKLFLSHFGNLLEHPPASFKDTSNSVEKRGFDTKDSLLLIDDYHPTSSPREKQTMELLAQKILRGYGDRVSRGRMRQDTSLRPDYLPRGMAIVTAEDMLSGGSSMARIFPVELNKTDIKLDRLTEAQLNSQKLSEAMSGYLDWIGQAMNSSEKSNLQKIFIDKRNDATHLGVHGRLIEASTWIYIGLYMGLKYAETITAISKKKKDAILNEAWGIFLNVADEQGEQVTEIKPSSKFINIVSQLISNKTIYTSPIKEEIRLDPIPNSSTHVGWHDKNYIYMLPDVIYNQVCQFLNKQGEQFPISASMLWKELGEAGISKIEITKGKDKDEQKQRTRYLPKKSIKGTRIRLLWLKRSAFQHISISKDKEITQSDSYEIVDSIDDM